MPPECLDAVEHLERNVLAPWADRDAETLETMPEHVSFHPPDPAGESLRRGPRAREEALGRELQHREVDAPAGQLEERPMLRSSKSGLSASTRRKRPDREDVDVPPRVADIWVSSSASTMRYS